MITANKEAATEYLPLKKRARKKAAAQDPRVEQARKLVQSVSSTYSEKPTERNREALTNAKKELQETYDKIAEEELDKAIKEVEDANEKSRHGKSWKLINPEGKQRRRESSKGQASKKDLTNGTPISTVC